MSRGRSSVPARSAVGTVLLLSMILLSACVSLPDSGPVRSRVEVGRADLETVPNFDPPGPAPGATPLDVVRGFLLAMTATPLTTATAREFLSAEAANRWVPEATTVVYGSHTLAATGADVTVRLADTAQLDRQGRWLGAARAPMRVHVLRLVREQGEWRIDNPVDALLVPSHYFDSYFRAQTLYFFDMSAQVLVPDPVYLPRGSQTPTRLVEGLLQGPSPDQTGVTRTFLPAKAQVALSVTVHSDGTAEVPLSDDILLLREDDLRLASAQLVWTLGQVVGVDAVRITVDGSPLDVSGVGPVQETGAWEEFAPQVNWASEELFGLRRGRVVTAGDGKEAPISGPFGESPQDLRQIAVDLPADQVAGVRRGGRSLVVAPTARSSDEPHGDRPTVILSGAKNLLRPSWDLFGQVWAIDRTRRGARVLVIRSGVPRALSVRGVSGRRVKAIAVSRDGTRLAVVVDVESGVDRVVISRVVRHVDGRVVRLRPAQRISLGDLQVDELRDVAWRTPESIAVLAGPTGGVPEVIVARIDGSSATAEVGSNSEILGSEAVRVVTSPAPGTPLYVATRAERLFELTATGSWTGAGIARGLGSPTFVG